MPNGIQQFCQRIPLIGEFTETIASLATSLLLILIMPFTTLPFGLALRLQREQSFLFSQEVSFIMTHYFKIVRLFLGVMLIGFLLVIPFIILLFATLRSFLPEGESLSGLTLASILFLLFLVSIPYILFNIRLSCIFFFFRDNPKAGVFAIIKKNWVTLRGHTWRLFILNLSFMGWLFVILLLSLPFASMTPPPPNGTPSLGGLIPLLLIFPLNAWVLLANSAFYDDLTGSNAPASPENTQEQPI